MTPSSRTSSSKLFTIPTPPSERQLNTHYPDHNLHCQVFRSRTTQRNAASHLNIHDLCFCFELSPWLCQLLILHLQALLIKSKSGRFAVQCVYMGSAIGVGYWLSIATLQTPEDLVSLPAARCLLTALRIALPCADCCSGRAPESCCCRASSKMGSLRPRTTKKCQRSSQYVIRGAWRKCSKILPSLKVLRSSQEASSEDTLSTLIKLIT